MCVGVTVWFGWGGVVPLCRLKHCLNLHKDTTPPQPNHTVTPTHTEPEQYNTWNKSTISRKLLKMDVLTFETCWAVNIEIIKQVTLSWSIFIQHTSIFQFMIYWPCILIYLCNENQLDALFIRSLFHQSTSRCFGHICSPSSGVTLYMYSNWYMLCCTVDCLMAFHPNPANRQSTNKYSTYHLLYIHSIPPDDGLQICPKHVEADWRNKLRINSASS